MLLLLLLVILGLFHFPRHIFFWLLHNFQCATQRRPRSIFLTIKIAFLLGRLPLLPLQNKQQQLMKFPPAGASCKRRKKERENQKKSEIAHMRYVREIRNFYYFFCFDCEIKNKYKYLLDQDDTAVSPRLPKPAPE